MVVDQEALGLRDSSIRATHQRKTKVTLRCTVVATTTTTTTIIMDYLETLRHNHFTKCLCSRCTILTSGLATILNKLEMVSLLRSGLVCFSVLFTHLSIRIYPQVRLSFLSLFLSSSSASYFLFTSAFGFR